uniref:CRIB domain-containing protein n=2 Tax=Panagrellus redivivus TaxID=6233 RepID=A0A7E4ZPR4_PANRE
MSCLPRAHGSVSYPSRGFAFKLKLKKRLSRMLLGSRSPPRFWLLNCCVSPQSDIGRVKIDRSMIGDPTDFRHLCHMGADDLTTAGSAPAVNGLLASKGDYDYSLPVPEHLREKDVPIQRAEAPPATATA